MPHPRARPRTAHRAPVNQLASVIVPRSVPTHTAPVAHRPPVVRPVEPPTRIAPSRHLPVPTDEPRPAPAPAPRACTRHRLARPPRCRCRRRFPNRPLLRRLPSTPAAVPPATPPPPPPDDDPRELRQLPARAHRRAGRRQSAARVSCSRIWRSAPTAASTSVMTPGRPERPAGRRRSDASAGKAGSRHAR